MMDTIPFFHRHGFSVNDALMATFNENVHTGSGSFRFYNNYVMDYLYADPYNILIF